MGGFDTSLYEILGVAPSATDAELKAAWRRRVVETHPDHGGTREEFAKVQAAWEVLSDSALRVDYDRQVAGDGDAFDVDLLTKLFEDAMSEAFTSVAEQLAAELTDALMAAMRSQQPDVEPPRTCAGTTTQGARCRKPPAESGTYCHLHDPAIRTARPRTPTQPKLPQRQSPSPDSKAGRGNATGYDVAAERWVDDQVAGRGTSAARRQTETVERTPLKPRLEGWRRYLVWMVAMFGWIGGSWVTADFLAAVNPPPSLGLTISLAWIVGFPVCALIWVRRRYRLT